MHDLATIKAMNKQADDAELVRNTTIDGVRYSDDEDDRPVKAGSHAHKALDIAYDPNSTPQERAAAIMTIENTLALGLHPMLRRQGWKGDLNWPDTHEGRIADLLLRLFGAAYKIKYGKE